MIFIYKLLKNELPISAENYIIMFENGVPLCRSEMMKLVSTTVKMSNFWWISHAHCSNVIMGSIGLKSPASRWFTQPFIQQITENIKAPRHWPLCWEFTGEFPAQMASNAENVYIWWRHHEWTWGAFKATQAHPADLQFSFSVEFDNAYGASLTAVSD